MNTKEFLSLLSKSRIYDLEHVRYRGMPAFDPVQPGLDYFLYRHHESYYRPDQDGPRTSASGLIIMSDQSGTHIDALSHQASDLKLYGGVDVTLDTETPWGFKKLGAEEFRPLIARGLLVDVADAVTDPMPEEHDITLTEFKTALNREGITVEKGDIVLVRTGYGKYWFTDLPKYRKAAGVAKETSLWLKEQNVAAVGADNLAFDYPEHRDPETKSLLPAHLHLLARGGIHIIENLNLEEISKDRVYEFAFVALPLKFKGATGSPIRPLAIKL
ncbi:MAG: cyclase family protein [Nitrososphaerota archaeon]|nr:cyclase family protein [Nitrososphaerota archaeon]MDG6924320.1 cyclase family protein [Nitrososphaerota archaeon]